MRLNRNWILPLATIGLIGLATSAKAGDYIESVHGDAGPLLATAGDTTLVGSPWVDGIQGRLRGGVDLFKIYVPDFSLFSATTDDPLTDAGLDTQLFLFAPDGTGIAVNDDISGGNLFSNLPVGDPFYSGRPGGYYYLGVSIFDRDPRDASNNLIFPNNQTGTWYNNNSNPLDHWGGASADRGNYRIRLTGVVGAVPEPGAVATAIAFGGALGGLVLRKRRKA